MYMFTYILHIKLYFHIYPLSVKDNSIELAASKNE